MARTKPAPVLNRVQSLITILGQVNNIPINNYKEIQVGDIYILYFLDGSVLPAEQVTNRNIPISIIEFTQLHGNWFYFKVTKRLYNLIKNTQLAENDFNLFLDITAGNRVIAYIHLKNARIDSTVATGSGTGGSPAAGTLVPTESRARTIISKNASTSTLVGTPDNYEQIWFGPTNLRQIFYQTTDFNTSNIVRSLTPATNAGAWTTRSYTIYSAEDKIVKPKSVPYVVDSYALSSQSGTKTAYLPSQTKAGDLVIAVKTALDEPNLPTGWTNLDSNDDSPEYRAYYKIITQEDIDDNLSIDTYDANEVIFAMNIRNFSNISVPVVKNTPTLTVGLTNIRWDPQVTSDAIQTTKPYQLGVFIGTKTIAEDFSEELDCVNEWQLVQTLNNTNKPGKALMVATYDAIEEQVIPPNQMAFKNSQDVLELAGGLAPTAISKPGRSITFLVDSA
jgi:hypothetical protein